MAASFGRDFWEEAFDRFERSGLTVAEFCEVEGCSVPTFYAWRKRIGAEGQPKFTELVVERAAESSSIEIELSGGERLRLTGVVDADNLQTVLRCLEQASC